MSVRCRAFFTDWLAALAPAVVLASFLPALTAAPAVAQDDVLKEAVAVFADACLKTAPTFAGAQAALEDKGFAIYPFAEGEFEFGRETGDIHGQVSANPDYPGCTVMNETLSELDAADRVADLLVETFGVTLEPWDYEGQQAGWRMPQDSGALYIIFNQGGLSVEYRDKTEG